MSDLGTWCCGAENLFRIYRLRDVVRIDPSKFGMSPEEAVLEELRKRYEGYRDRNLGIVIMVRNPKVDPIGYIIFGDGASYHRVEFEVLTYVPTINEVVEGQVEQVNRAGLIVKIGPLEGFIHISQVADEEVSFDPVRGSVICKQTKRIITKGDVVRARITSVSLGGSQRAPRVVMTMRQPFLGKKEWIDEYIKRRRGS